MQRINKIILFILIISVVLILVSYASGFIHKWRYPYTAGKTGKKCYETGYEHSNIQYHEYFKDLQSCLDYVQQNK